MSGEHSHWERYHVRIVEYDTGAEYVQCICLEDGQVFNKVQVKY